ncbi:MAG: DUF4384 domain-containing protein [Candidatus Delongbacteria bacterium]|nr:DUF4384 domain-containing protein [bacterium]MBL7033633.1 DUF4384 domain-containing protein [Candidatus Delongbacteria bacterium]
MKKEQIDKLMQEWVEREERSAPDLHPTSEMYQQVKSKKRTGLVSLTRNYLAIGTVAAALLLLVVLYFLYLQPSVFERSPIGGELAFLGQRSGFITEPGVMLHPVRKKGKGSRRDTNQILTRPFGSIDKYFSRVQFQFQRADSPYVEGIDLMQPMVISPQLTDTDNYRLYLDPLSDCYLYIYQSSPAGIIVQLFPNATLSTLRNPLAAGGQLLIPEEPDWLFLSQEPGAHMLYILVSTRRQEALEKSYRRCLQSGDSPFPEPLSSDLYKQINMMIEVAAEGTSGTVFSFIHSPTLDQ